MTDTTPPRILVGVEVSAHREGGGEVVLSWQTSRKVIQYVDIGAGEMVPTEMVEPFEVSETISCETNAKLDATIERYRLQAR